jgi:hypothetical protein
MDTLYPIYVPDTEKLLLKSCWSSGCIEIRKGIQYIRCVSESEWIMRTDSASFAALQLVWGFDSNCRKWSEQSTFYIIWKKMHLGKKPDQLFCWKQQA